MHPIYTMSKIVILFGLTKPNKKTDLEVSPKLFIFVAQNNIGRIKASQTEFFKLWIKDCMQYLWFDTKPNQSKPNVNDGTGILTSPPQTQECTVQGRVTSTFITRILCKPDTYVAPEVSSFSRHI